MRLHRFYISPEDFSPKSGLSKETYQEIYIGNSVGTEEGSDHERLIHQWRDIFRFGEGDRVLLFNKEAGEWLAEFISLDKKRGAVLKIVEQNLAGIDSVTGISGGAAKAIPQKNITLYMAIIKNSNFDLVVEKVTELGASKIIPIMTERTVKSGLNFERLRKLAIEASEQSGRIDIPEISEIMNFDNALSDAKQLIDSKSAFFGHISDNKVDSSMTDLTSAALYIGPEGGWTDEEILKFEQVGVLPMSLGQFVLRAETAAIVGVSKLS